MAKTKKRRKVGAARSRRNLGKKSKQAGPAPVPLDLSEWNEWLIGTARAAILETPAPPPRNLEGPPTWDENAFSLLGGRRPSDVLSRNPIALLHPLFSMTLLALNETAVGPPRREAGLSFVRRSKRGKGSRTVRLCISPAKKCDEPGCKRIDHIIPTREATRRAFIWDWTASEAAVAELRRCFDALTTRRTADGRRISPREWFLAKESENLEKAGIPEKQRAALLSSLDGRKPATESVAISRARLKLGQRRHAGPERKRRI